jgi:hypothetical protein
MYDQPLASCEADMDSTIREELWLLGQPPLQSYLDFIEDEAIDPADPRVLCDEWRRANDYYHDLEISEAGFADEMQCHDLDPALAPLADAVVADARFCDAFDKLPTSIGMVELDRLVVYQPHVTRQFLNSLQAQLGPEPDAEALFRFCLPLGRQEAPVRVRRAGSKRFIFSCESSDFRFLEALLLRADRINDFAKFGATSSVAGVVIGFGSNFLNVLRSDNRFVLQNGYHRACALRALGVKYAPAAIQTVTRRDELAIAATHKVFDSAAFYFKAARPPLLKDFFDPQIRKVVPVRRTKTFIEVSFEVREFHMEE